MIQSQNRPKIKHKQTLDIYLAKKNQGQSIMSSYYIYLSQSQEQSSDQDQYVQQGNSPQKVIFENRAKTLPAFVQRAFEIASNFKTDLDRANSFESNLSSSINISIIKGISQFIATHNKQPFINKLSNQIEKPLLKYIQVHPSPIYDKLGRATYFTIRLAGKSLFLYQPGTFMFTGAVHSQSDLMTFAHGSQQNGPLMGNSCAIFITKFICNLSKEYQQRCRRKSKQCQSIYPKILQKLLSDMLLGSLGNSYAREDAQQHGRLIQMRYQLIKILEEG